MINPSRKVFRFGGVLLIPGFLILPVALFNSCNDTGTSPYTPHILYALSAVSGEKDSAIAGFPDTLKSDGGAVTGYSISPALPAGLTFDPTTGFISGKPTALDTPGTRYTVTGTGPRGTATTSIYLCVGEPGHLCNISPPYVSYSQPFVWTNPGIAITPDTGNSTLGGPVFSYSISPSLPAGMSFSTTTGLISGTPTATMAATEYHIIATGPVSPPDTNSVYIGVYSNTYPTALLAIGEQRFMTICSGCHGFNAKGVPGAIPPLYHSDFLMANRHRPIHIELMGLPNSFDTATSIIVSGDTFASSMFAPGGNDSEVAGVLTFLRATFNGAANGVTDYMSVQEVHQVRDSIITACNAHPSLQCAGAVDSTN